MAPLTRERTMANVYIGILADLFEAKQITSADLTVAQREAVHVLTMQREVNRQRQRAQIRLNRRRRAA